MVSEKSVPAKVEARGTADSANYIEREGAGGNDSTVPPLRFAPVGMTIL